MHFSSIWLLISGVPLLQASENTGIKMTMEFGSAPNSSPRNIYLQRDRKRMEYRNSFGQKTADGSLQPIYGPRLVSITRCDLGQSFELNLDTSEYTARAYPPKPFTKQELEARGMASPVTYLSDKPTLRIETSTSDTGERKEMFGHVARHIITTRKQIPLEGSRSGLQESVTDGWYIDSKIDFKPADSGDIDLYQRLPCDRKWPEGKPGHSYMYWANGSQPRERPEFVAMGEPETGFALLSVTTTKNTQTLPDGTTKQSDFKSEVRVTQLEKGPLDPALFEIPPGFKQVEKIERNPPAPPPSLASQMNDLWQRVKASVAGLFNR